MNICVVRDAESPPLAAKPGASHLRVVSAVSGTGRGATRGHQGRGEEAAGVRAARAGPAAHGVCRSRKGRLAIKIQLARLLGAGLVYAVAGRQGSLPEHRYASSRPLHGDASTLVVGLAFWNEYAHRHGTQMWRLWEGEGEGEAIAVER